MRAPQFAGKVASVAHAVATGAGLLSYDPPMKKLILFLAALLALPVSATELQWRDAWIRAAPPGVKMLAGYVNLTNPGKTPILITGVRSAAFESIEIHETVTENGVAKMRPLGQLSIAAGQTVQMAPGGMHLMLTEPKEPLAVGQTVVIEFLDAAGAPLPVIFNLRSPTRG